MKIHISGLYDEQAEKIKTLHISEEEKGRLEITLSQRDFMHYLSFKQRVEIVKLLKEKGVSKFLLEDDSTSIREMTEGEKEKRRIARKENEKDKTAVNFHKDFQRILMGISAEAYFSDSLFEFYPELETFLRIHPDMLVVQQPTGGTSILNMKAARWIIGRNADLFPPEASRDTNSWMQKTEEWERGRNDPTKDIRYGLLSGFDRKSTEAYQVWNGAVEKLEKYGTEDAYEVFKKLKEKGSYEEAEALIASCKNPASETELLTSDEVAVLLKKSSYNSKLDCSIFDDEAPQRIESEIAKRMENCGIQVSEDFKKYIAGVKTSTDL